MKDIGRQNCRRIQVIKGLAQRRVHRSDGRCRRAVCVRSTATDFCDSAEIKIFESAKNNELLKD